MTSFAQIAIYGCVGSFIIVVSATPHKSKCFMKLVPVRVVHLFRISARGRVIVEFESFSTGQAALGLPGGLDQDRAVSPFASGLCHCGAACLLLRKCAI